MQVLDPFVKIREYYLQQTCAYANCDAPIVKVYKLWANNRCMYIRLECKDEHSDIFEVGLARWK